MIQIFSDGGSRGNPGKAASAYVIYKDKKIIKQDAKYLGITTNNVAEYNGVILALTELTQNEQSSSLCDKQIIFNMDSELVVKQLNGLYKVKSSELLKLHNQVKEIIRGSSLKIKFQHVPRAQNAFADNLVNEKLDDSSRR